MRRLRTSPIRLSLAHIKRTISKSYSGKPIVFSPALSKSPLIIRSHYNLSSASHQKERKKLKFYAFSISNKFPSELPSATAPSGKRIHSSYRSHFVSLDSCSLESGLKGTFRATLPRLLELLCLFKSRSADCLCLANQNNYRHRLGKRHSISSEQRLAILFSSEIASTFLSFLLQVSKSPSLGLSAIATDSSWLPVAFFHVG